MLNLLVLKRRENKQKKSKNDSIFQQYIKKYIQLIY